MHTKQHSHPSSKLFTGVVYKALCLFLALNSFLNAKSQGFLKAKGQQIVNEKGDNVLLRGIGLGGWMLQEGYMLKIPGEGAQHTIRARIEELIGPAKTQEFYDAWLANHTRKIDIDSLKAWGFNSVRLPMHYNLYTLPTEKEPVAAQNTWLQKGFALTDSLLSWCKANKMFLILDLHATPGGQGNDLNISDRDTSYPSLWASEANKQKMIELWRRLAEHYANEPWIGGYDIINEPNFGFLDPVNDKNGLKEQKNDPLKKLMQDITAAIRSVDKNHIIIIEGNGWGNNYNGILPTWDSNMVLSFHKYWNYNDQASIKGILNLSTQYNVPVWLGETGENSNVWFTEAIRLLESNNIGWAWWPLKKIGFNNPLEIKSNPGYEELLKYWNKKGGKPDKSSVYSALLKLAADTKFEANVFHRDVIDAMFRQPFSDTSKPFKTNLIRNNSIINAVDYDLGRNGVAYFDNDTADYHVSGKPGIGNRGRTYRNDGVDIRKDSAVAGSYYVSDIESGEWLQYTINIAQAGFYTLTLTVASDTTGGQLSVVTNTNAKTVSIEIPDTGGKKNWQTIKMNNIMFKQGGQQIKIHSIAGGFNFKAVQFTLTGHS